MNQPQRLKVSKVILLLEQINLLFGFVEHHLNELKLHRTSKEIRKAVKDIDKTNKILKKEINK